MIVTTTDGIEGRRIQAYLGLVAGEAILGANLFKDFFASVRDVVGGRAGAYEKEMGKARQAALEDMIAAARQMGADAIVGVDMDYEVIGGDNKTLLMVSVNGTAVKLA